MAGKVCPLEFKVAAVALLFVNLATAKMRVTYHPPPPPPITFFVSPFLIILFPKLACNEIKEFGILTFWFVEFKMNVHGFW